MWQELKPLDARICLCSSRNPRSIMPKFSRVVVPEYPHHVTQRGSRRQQVFFCEEDYQAYTELVAQAKAGADAEIWAYCLMPNHVHLVVVPHRGDSLARLCRNAHSKYAYRVNKRENWQGHLWQERFHSFPMDEEHLLATVRYVEMNPVRAGLCQSPMDWPWSSVHAHQQGENDLLVNVIPMLRRVDNWSAYLDVDEMPAKLDKLRKHSRTGRPAGNEDFLRELGNVTGRSFQESRARTGTKKSLSP